VPPLTLYASDELQYVAQFGFDNMDLLELDFAIEKRLDKKMPKGLGQYAVLNKKSDMKTLIRLLSEKGMLRPSSFPLGSRS
jgi:hypothetical protein